MADPNPSPNNYQPPPGYALVPVDQLGQPQAQSQTQQAPTESIQQDSNNNESGTVVSDATTFETTFPTPDYLSLTVHYVDDTRDLFLPAGASPSDPVGYEARYRSMDYTDRSTPHTTVYQRYADEEGNLQFKIAGSSIYHHYWSNKLTMSFPFLSDSWEYGHNWISEVGICESRELQFKLGEDEGKQFVIVLTETNNKTVASASMDTLRTGTVDVWIPLEDQKQMDEIYVMVICYMQRYRIKLVKDSKSLLKDEDWAKLGRFSRLANGAVKVAGGAASHV